MGSSHEATMGDQNWPHTSSMKRLPVLLKLPRSPLPLTNPLVWYSCLDWHLQIELMLAALTTRLLGVMDVGNPEVLKDISQDGVNVSASALASQG